MYLESPLRVQKAQAGFFLSTADGFVVKVDPSDYHLVSRYQWRVQKNHNLVYAYAYINGKRVLMHRFLLNPPAGFSVDHIDHNGLNNQRENLRVATPSQNAANRRPCAKTSKFLGVSFDVSNRTHKVWRSQITKNGKTRRIGRFYTEEEAALAYDRAAKEDHGEFANLNFK